ncbi:MAG: DUF748 domain-containing protein [Alphaproteobacteria bacterium]|nr:DUF748 domain-containing protein [Alphaproteobacteria bacterium]
MLDAVWAGWSRLSCRLRLSLTLLGAFLLLSLPALLILPEVGLRWGLGEAMRRMGMSNVSIADTRIELLDGRLVIRSFRATPKIGEALGLKTLDFAFRWLPLLHREVAVQSLDLSGLSISLVRDGDKLLVNGAPIDLSSGGEGSAWSFDIDRLNLAASRVDLADGALKLGIEIEQLELRSVKRASPTAPLHFHFKGKVDGNPLEMAGTATPFAGSPGFELTLSTDQLDLALFAPLLAGAGLDVLNGKLSSSLTLSGAGLPLKPEIRAGGKLSFSDLKAQASGQSFEAEGLEIVAENLAWSGEARQVDWQGGLTLNSAGMRGAGIAARTKGLTWLGHAVLGLGEQDISARFEGKLSDAGIGLDTPSLLYRHDRAMTWGEIDLGQNQDGAIFVSAKLAVDANGLAMQDAVAKADILSAERFLSKAITLDRARFGPDGAMEAEGLTFDGLALKMSRPASPSGDKGPAKAEGKKQAETETAGAMAPLQRIRLGRFAIAGDSRFDFVDNTPKQPVGITFDKVKLSLSNLDSAEPGSESPFELEARAGAALISIQGSAKPFATGISAKFSSRVKAFELPPLSPYTSETLGVELQTGHLDGEMTVSLENGALSGKVDLALSNLFAAQPDPNAPLAKHASMPVSMVLDLLRDGDDRIRLSIPVSGDLADPQFDFSDAMSQAIGGAMRQTALTTLKVVFPVVILIEKMTDQQAPTLAPITFSPGDERMDEQGLSRLSAIADLMKGRPKLKLSLCPVSASGADWPVLLERRKRDELGLLYSMQKIVNAEAKPEKTPPDVAALKALAERRAQTVKQELMERAGVDAGRLFACLPKLDESAGAAGRVDISL